MRLYTHTHTHGNLIKEKINVFNNKGITLVSLVITIILILIVSSTTINVSYKRFEINSFNKMKNDLELLADKVSNYYLQTGNIPVVLDSSGNKVQYTFTTLDFDKDSADNSVYYILDLEAMNGLLLNYGKSGFENLNTSEDVYVINEQSHVIYYVKGIKLNEKLYHYITGNKQGSSIIPPTTPQVKIASGELVTKTDGTTYYWGAVSLEFIPGISGSGEIAKTTYSINGGAETDISTLTDNLYKLNDMNAEYSITLKTYGTNGTISTTNSIIKTKRANGTVKKNLNKVLSTTNNTPLVDEFENKIVVPAGFKILVDITTNYTAENIDVTKGIVVQDEEGNQFVWIPVGTIYTNEEKTANKTIKLGRYSNFTKTDGAYIPAQNASDYGTKVEISYYTEDTTAKHNSKYKNSIAKNIGEFCTKANLNGGYYIGRYEARVENYDASNISTSNSDSSTDWTGYVAESGKELKLVSKANSQVWNYVTQKKASSLCQSMYTDKLYESDLVNSYAWDTAIIFFQEFGDNSTYASKISVNSNLANKGTSGMSTKDVICNVYDMASNCYEWSTETFSSSGYPCAKRGGSCFSISYSYMSYRSSSGTTNAYNYYSFRPLLYL